MEDLQSLTGIKMVIHKGVIIRDELIAWIKTNLFRYGEFDWIKLFIRKWLLRLLGLGLLAGSALVGISESAPGGDMGDHSWIASYGRSWSSCW